MTEATPEDVQEQGTPLRDPDPDPDRPGGYVAAEADPADVAEQEEVVELDEEEQR